jgi:hypothetical protein
MTDFQCGALDFAGHTYCSRCRLEWPTGLAAAPACKPKADPPIGIETMYRVLTDQAQYVADSQLAAIEAGFRTRPYEPEMRKHAVLMAAAQLLARIYQDKQIMDLLKGTGSRT